MNNNARRPRRIVAGMLASALALSVLPILGFTGVASAADDLPPLADPIGAGNFCEGAPTTEPFTDVNGPAEPGTDDPSYDEIVCLVATELTQGTTATTYSPNGTITRRQMAMFIKRVADLANELEITDLADLPAYDGTPDFSDHEAEEADFEAAIGQLSQADIVGGFPDGEFKPGAPVSRRQMAAFIVRLQEFLGSTPFEPSGNAFDDDDDESQEVEDNFNILGGEGIFQGDGAGNVFPGSALTRRQMANILLRKAQVLFANGDISGAFEPAAPAGPITLNSTTAQQGSTITGTVSDPSTVNSVSVSGCGFSNQNVTISSGGAFQLTLPTSQGVGSCTLDFVVARTNGDIEGSSIPITVTAAPSANTGAPDLLSASALAIANTVTYVFDEEVTSTGAGFFGDFAIYDAAGARNVGVNAAILSDGKSVVVSFPAGTVALATLAGVQEDAVEDVAGNANYAASAPLTGTTTAAGITTAPDLVSVGNARTTATNEQVVDFTFDEAIKCTTPLVASPCFGVGDVDETLFQLVLNDGTVFDGFDTEAISADRRTISIVFGLTVGGPPTVPLTQVDRGVTEGGAVQDTAAVPNFNVLQATEIAASSLNPAGGTTDGADLVSARVAGTNSVEYTFDEPVDAFTVDPNGFGIASSTAVQTAGVSAVRSATDAKKVTVTFTAGEVGNAVLANVDDGNDNPTLSGPAVEDTVSPVVVAGNNDDSVALQGIGTQAGRTALADLVAVFKIQNQFGDYLVTYQFDAPVPCTAIPGACVPDADFEFTLVDVNGQITTATDVGPGLGSGIVDPDDPTRVRISTNSGTVGPGIPVGFTNAQVAGATVGAVYDNDPTTVNTASGNTPDITEGDAIVATGF